MPVFGTVVCHLISLGFRLDVPTGILEADGAKQNARQNWSGGRVLA